ncbi:hypothetical protein [Scytonema sp. NUACC21]
MHKVNTLVGNPKTVVNAPETNKFGLWTKKRVREDFDFVGEFVQVKLYTAKAANREMHEPKLLASVHHCQTLTKFIAAAVTIPVTQTNYRLGDKKLKMGFSRCREKSGEGERKTGVAEAIN